MEVLKVIKELKQCDFTYTLMGVNEATHILINNHKTNDSSVIVPVIALRELLQGDK